MKSIFCLAVLFSSASIFASQTFQIEARVKFDTYDPDTRQLSMLEEIKTRAAEYGWKAEILNTDAFGYCAYNLSEKDSWQTLLEETVRRGGCTEANERCLLDIKWHNQTLILDHSNRNVYRTATLMCATTGYKVILDAKDDLKAEAIGPHFTIYKISRRLADFSTDYRELDMRLPQTGQYCSEGSRTCEDVAVYVLD